VVAEVLFTKLTELQQPQAELAVVVALVYSTAIHDSPAQTFLMDRVAVWH
jgi:hypothetical protein